MRARVSAVAGCAVLGLLGQIQAQITYDVSTSGLRLFNAYDQKDLASSSRDLAPTGATVWIVSDLDGNGLAGFSQLVDYGSTVLQSAFQDIVGGLGPDTLVTHVHPSFGGGKLTKSSLSFDAGKVSRAHSYYAILWQDHYGDNAYQFGNVGDKFDIKQLSYSSADLAQQLVIVDDMYADKFTVVPEPAETATAVGLVMLGSGWLFRRYKRA